MRDLVAVTPLLMIFTLACVVWKWRRSTEKPKLLALCFVLLFLFSWPPAAWVTTYSLECWYPVAPRPEGEAEAIVVLSGGIRVPGGSRPVVMLRDDTYTRTRHAAWLHKNWRPLPVVATGGHTSPGDGGPSLAAAMSEYLAMEGVPRELIWTEEESRTTHENALFTAKLLRARGIRRIALVTEASHMLRAELCFRKQGLEVVSAPCDFRTENFGSKLRDYLPRWQAFESHEATFHEWLGLVWYWLRGHI